MPGMPGGPGSPGGPLGPGSPKRILQSNSELISETFAFREESPHIVLEIFPLHANKH